MGDRFRKRSWQDKRPGFDYRVIWYEPGFDGQTIRLRYDTPAGWWNEYHKTEEEAKSAYAAFVLLHGGTITLTG